MAEYSYTCSTEGCSGRTTGGVGGKTYCDEHFGAALDEWHRENGSVWLHYYKPGGVVSRQCKSSCAELVKAQKNLTEGGYRHWVTEYDECNDAYGRPCGCDPYTY